MPPTADELRLHCEDCGVVVPARDERALYHVTGWAPYRRKGTNRLLDERRTGKAKCASCAALFKAGAQPSQGSLL